MDAEYFDEISNDPMAELSKLMERIQNTINNNMDHTPMEIGDRVVPWDGSALFDINGKKVNVVDELFASTLYWIIIANREKRILKETFVMCEYLQDLIIAHPETKALYRTSSEMVKHYTL
jgi:hypothetical protein